MIIDNVDIQLTDQLVVRPDNRPGGTPHSYGIYLADERIGTISVYGQRSRMRNTGTLNTVRVTSAAEPRNGGGGADMILTSFWTVRWPS